MEYFDILNSSGVPTGAKARKGTLLKDGEYYLGVHAYIFNPSYEFLLQQRSFAKDFLPGIWDIHMGHVIAGETSKQGMVREIREEIGLSLCEADLYLTGTVIWEDDNHITDIYFLKTDFEPSALSFQHDEVIGVKTVSKDEMMDLVSKMDYRPSAYREHVLRAIRDL